METRHRHEPPPAVERELALTPLLASVVAAGTTHLYGDTADVEELERLATFDAGSLRLEIDGNTANQPLVAKVLERYLDRLEEDPEWRPLAQETRREELLPRLYHLVLARIGGDMLRALAAGRRWEASLQLHMGLRHQPEELVAAGRELRSRVPTALVKVPFTPDAPHCLLVARQLERDGHPVNLTSTFSARQVAVAALIAKATRANVFLGRINSGLKAELLGEHVVLEAQRCLRELRRRHAVHTQLIAASIREWRTIARLAGCDAMTASCEVLREFIEQREVPPEEIEQRQGLGFEHELEIDPGVRERLGDERIARLHRVEPELIEFLLELRAELDSREEDSAPTGLDGDALRARFEEAGFGDLFHVPDDDQRRELAESKLPKLDGGLALELALDTHYSLLANADFDRHQDAIDAELLRRVARS